MDSLYDILFMVEHISVHTEIAVHTVSEYIWLQFSIPSEL